MRPAAISPRLVQLLRVGITAGFVLLLIGLSGEWLPFGWAALLFVLAVLLPLCWPRQAGSWPGVLVLMALSWLPVWALQGDARAPAVTTLLLLVMLSALAAAPSALVLLMWRRSASVALMLLGFALFPPLLTMLLARTGSPPLDQTGTVATLGYLAWLPGIWYPLLGMCLGSLGFVVSLSWLAAREVRRSV